MAMTESQTDALLDVLLKRIEKLEDELLVARQARDKDVSDLAKRISLLEMCIRTTPSSIDNLHPILPKSGRLCPKCGKYKLADRRPIKGVKYCRCGLSW